MDIDGFCYFTDWKTALPKRPGIYYVLRDDRTPLFYGVATHLLNPLAGASDGNAL